MCICMRTNNIQIEVYIQGDLQLKHKSYVVQVNKESNKNPYVADKTYILAITMTINQNVFYCKNCTWSYRAASVIFALSACQLTVESRHLLWESVTARYCFFFFLSMCVSVYLSVTHVSQQFECENWSILELLTHNQWRYRVNFMQSKYHVTGKFT